jgi:TatD DNase family protein
MQFVDTHCHIHESSYPLDRGEVIERAHAAGVTRMICVGTDEKSSEEALEFAAKHDGIYATIGVHPHETKDGWGKLEAMAAPQTVSSEQPVEQRVTRGGAAPENVFSPTEKFSGADRAAGPASARKLIAVGEIGLDYFYTHSPREMQIKALEAQIDLALRHDLPVIFHVREAFDDFWPIYDNFHGVRGELHSFTDSAANLEQGLKRGLYVGVNGISTFTKVEEQRAVFASVPLDRLLLETDAPFLTPVPFRGKVNEPAFVKQIAEFHADIRNTTVDQIADATSMNAQTLFNLS